MSTGNFGNNWSPVGASAWHAARHAGSCELRVKRHSFPLRLSSPSDLRVEIQCGKRTQILRFAGSLLVAIEVEFKLIRLLDLFRLDRFQRWLKVWVGDLRGSLIALLNGRFFLAAGGASSFDRFIGNRAGFAARTGAGAKSIIGHSSSAGSDRRC